MNQAYTYKQKSADYDDNKNNELPKSNDKLPEIPMDVIQYHILPFTNHLQQIDIVKNRISNGDHRGQILMDAAKTGQVSAISFLYKRYTIPSYGIMNAIRLAAENGHVPIIRYFCELKNNEDEFVFNPTDHYNGLLRWAAKYGQLNVIQYLCTTLVGSNLCDPTDHDNQAIIVASAYGYLNIVQYLSELVNSDGTLRCNPDHYFDEAIRVASHYDHFDIVMYLSMKKYRHLNDEGEINRYLNASARKKQNCHHQVSWEWIHF